MPSATAGSPPLRQAAFKKTADQKTASTKSTVPQKSYGERLKSAGKKFNDDSSIYSTYGFLDTATLGTNVVKYYYDITHSMEPSDIVSEAMYNWLRTPEGIISTCATIIPLAFFSAFANSHYSSDTAAGKALYRGWQMFRDAVKGLRNAYRGTKSTLTAIRLLATQDFTYLLMPLGLLFGLISVGNRVWSRNMVNERKDMQDDNKSLLNILDNWGSFRQLTALPKSDEDLKKHGNGFRLITNDEDPSKNGLYYISYNYENKKTKAHHLIRERAGIDNFLIRLKQKTDDDTNPLRPSILQWRDLLPGIAEKHYAAFHKDIATKTHRNHQSLALQRRAYASASYAGFIDGLYMFMGLISMTALSSWALIVVSSVSVFFSAACILTRLHEEKTFQQNLVMSQQKTELSLTAKTVETHLAKLIEIKAKLMRLEADGQSTNNVDHIYLTRLQKKADIALNKTLAEFHESRKKLHDASKVSTMDTILVGLRHALAAYTALVCMAFAASIFSVLLFATPLPEFVALAVVMTGAALFAGFTLYSLSVAKEHEKKQIKHNENKQETIYKFIEKYKNKSKEDLLKEFPEEGKQSASQSLFELGLDVALPTYYLLSWTDILRALFSGLMKAVKLIFFGLALFDNLDSYDNSNPLLWLMIIPSAILFSFVWAGRALAKYHKDLFSDSTKDKAPANQDAHAENVPDAPEKEAGVRSGDSHTFEGAVNQAASNIDDEDKHLPNSAPATPLRTPSSRTTLGFFNRGALPSSTDRTNLRRGSASNAVEPLAALFDPSELEQRERTYSI
ncbi:MAG: hypothetical protein K0U37_02915 [Gammaproteobacteria bacterium]|nr:hypothetical protein [Gammaproteobacteria bacterium]